MRITIKTAEETDPNPAENIRLKSQVVLIDDTTVPLAQNFDYNYDGSRRTKYEVVK